MPLTLRPPRSAKTPNWTIRGTYLGVYVERTAGTADRRLAETMLRETRRQIERGEYRPEAIEPPREPTFADAALGYLRAGGEAAFLSAIIDMIGPLALRDRPVKDIDQLAIDAVATSLYPTSKPATRNRQVYTPISAVMKHVGIERKIRRPKGWRGSKATSWLRPEQAFTLLKAAAAIEMEFGAFCTLALYTGMRLGDLVNVRLGDLHIDREMLYLPTAKNDDPRAVHLPPVAVKALRAIPPRPERPRKIYGVLLPNGAAGRGRRDAGKPFLQRDPNEKLFRFCAGGRLRDMLSQAMRDAQLSFPPRQGGFHLFCHTYGTWMKQFGGLDTYGLTRTGRWKDPDSADRYAHTDTSWESRQADLLPTIARVAIRGKSGELSRNRQKR